MKTPAQTTQSQKSGFTLIEVLIVLAITVLVGYLSLNAFSTYTSSESLEKSADAAVSYLDKARTATINSKNDLQYGVKFASTTVTLFQGTSYSSSAASNVVYSLPSTVTISAMTLTGNVSSVYFSSITGKPNATGTVTFKNGGRTKSLIIYGSGLSEVQ